MGIATHTLVASNEVSGCKKEKSDSNALLSCVASSSRRLTSPPRSVTWERTKLNKWDAWHSLAKGAAAIFVEDDTNKGSLATVS